METKSIAFSAAIPVSELLHKHNYTKWTILVRTYLEGQDLWKDIMNDNTTATATSINSQKQKYGEDAIKVWRRRNFMALHVIQTSCGPDAFSEISKIRTARAAWQILERKYDTEQYHLKEKIRKENDNNYLQYADLYKAVLRGDLIATKEFLDSQPEAVRKAITDKGETALHIAVTAGHAHIVKELVDQHHPDDQDGDGCTYGMTKEDLRIEDGDGCTALMKALEYGRSELAHYLYTRTPLRYKRMNQRRYLRLLTLAVEREKKGAMLLNRAIYSRNLDIALDLISRYPRWTYALDDRGVSPFLALASMPHIFPSGNRLGFWKQLIYNNCIHIDESTRFTHDASLDINSDGRLVSMQSARSNHETRLDISSDGHLVTMQSVPGGVLLRHLVSIYIAVRKYLLVPAKSFVRNFLGIEQLCETKRIHVQSQELLDKMCEEIPKIFQARQPKSEGVYDAINLAVKNGIFEFVLTTFSKVDPRVLENIAKKNLMNIFMLAAVLYRHSEIFSLLIQRGRHTGLMKNRVISFGDRNDGNNDDNILHMTGIVKDSIRFNRSSGAALQMQRELQWFKEVERISDPDMRECINKDGLTPQQLFTKNHENMMEKGEKWMKDTASSCTVVGALIITIMFAVAFTAPGGYEQTTGFPIFLKKKLFMLFIISDTLSLFSSTTSVLMFLGIRTSRYAEEDFLEYLPRQMIIGLLTLFCSIATMMITFSSALLIILHEQLHVAIPLICLAGVPVTFFIWIQFPILKDMIMSTYFPGLFNRKMKLGFK